MTLAHEIQQLIRFGTDQAVWAYSAVVLNLSRDKIKELASRELIDHGAINVFIT
jgi:hypothetical protein